MQGLTGALLATSLVLAAVFVPVSFLGGITGLLYRQFAITIVVSVLISAVVALTLSPAMCALLLRPAHGRKNFVFRKINDWLATGNRKYTGIIGKALANPRRVLAGFGMVLVFIFVLNKVVPSSFMPEEDQGYFKVELELPEGATLERTREVTDRAVEFVTALPAVDYVQNVTGFQSPGRDESGACRTDGDFEALGRPERERAKRGCGDGRGEKGIEEVSGGEDLSFQASCHSGTGNFRRFRIAGGSQGRCIVREFGDGRGHFNEVCFAKQGTHRVVVFFAGGNPPALF